MAPRVSVLMPVAGWSEWLQQALDSILNQSLTNLEILLIGYPDIVDWSDRLITDSRVRFLVRDSAGIVSALNTGLRHAQGTYIARMDADDISLPDRLRTQLDYLETTRVDIVGARVSLISEIGQVSTGNQRYVDWLNTVVTPAQTQLNAFVECVLPHPTFFARKSVFDALENYHDRGWPEDYDFLLRAQLSQMTMGKPDNILFHWRDHPRRLSRTDSRYHRENFIRLKVWALRQSLLGGKSVILCGTGRTARLWHDVLVENNIDVKCFVEHDEVTHRTSKRHLPIISYTQLLHEWHQHQKTGAAAEQLIVSVVSAAGAGELIRGRFNQSGLKEGDDYVVAG